MAITNELITPTAASRMVVEISQPSCGLCTRVHRDMLNTANGFNYDVPAPTVSEVGFDLTCECVVATREAHFLQKDAKRLCAGGISRKAPRRSAADFPSNYYKPLGPKQSFACETGVESE